MSRHAIPTPFHHFAVIRGDFAGTDSWADEALVIGQARVIDGDGAILNGKTPDTPSTSAAIQSRLVTAAGELSF
jgi:hypothetical protein